MKSIVVSLMVSLLLAATGCSTGESSAQRVEAKKAQMLVIMQKYGYSDKDLVSFAPDEVLDTLNLDAFEKEVQKVSIIRDQVIAEQQENKRRFAEMQERLTSAKSEEEKAAIYAEYPDIVVPAKP